MFKSIKEFFFGKPTPKEEAPYKVEVESKPDPVVVEVVTPQPLVVEQAPSAEPVVATVEKEVKPKKPRAKKPPVVKKEEVKPVKAKKPAAKKETPAVIKASKPRTSTKSTK
jgi:hypothetical protein